MSLHLTRLKVEQLRRFRQPFELADLQPGLNVFTGPNEAGKSTLVRAIRAAFFERYRSKAVDDLRPWGDSGATPSVELAFELDGQPGLLAKSFLGSKARCDLRIGSQTWNGTDAEDHLAQLFGFAFAGKGASKAEHWGIPGLLWVEQGAGQDVQLAASHAHGHLHQALERHLRDSHAAALTATGGDAVLDAIEALRDGLLTATGKPKGDLAVALADVQQSQAQCAELQAKVQTYQQQVDELSRLRSQHARDEADRPWDALQAQVISAQHALSAAQQANDQLTQARQLQGQLQSQHGLLLQQLAGYAQQDREATQRGQQSEQAKARLLAAQTQLESVQAQHTRGQAALTAAQQRWREAQQAAHRRQLLQQLNQLRHEMAQVEASVAQAREAEARLAALRQQAAEGAGAIQATDLQRLRQLDSRAHQARLRMQDLATHIQFKLLPGQHIDLIGGGQSSQLQGEGERLLVSTSTLVLPGLGEMRIQPGGQDLSELARQLQEAEQALAEALEALGVAALAQAEQRHLQQVQQAQDIQLAKQALSLSAPQGLPALLERQAQLQVDWQGTEAALQALPAAAEGAAPSLADAEAANQHAEQAFAQAHQALAHAQAERAAASARAEAADREWQMAQQLVSAPERAQAQAEAQSRLLEVKAQLDAQQGRVEALQTQVQQARPDILAQDVLRFERSLAQMRQSHQQRGTQIAVLEQTLAQQGAQGLEEALAESRGALARGERRLAELQRRANALQLLVERLQAKRQAALDRLQAPLQQHLQRYLSLLFPGATVSVNDMLVPEALTRTGGAGQVEAGAFDQLSFGAREQLALISRFAYADLLREAGRPTLIILDDALVHSDSQRLAMMKRVVFDASQRHQVLLFSCHPDSWRDMGVPARALG